MIELLPHNEKTYHRILEIWMNNNKVGVVQPTGTGKSFLILKCMELFKGKQKLVLAPSHYILEQLKKHNGGDIENCEFMTYTALMLKTEDELNNLNPSVIVLDEFHRCGGREWQTGIQKLLELNPNSKILGTSATPVRYLDGERDMSYELFDSVLARNMSLVEALVEGLITAPKYVSAMYSFSDEFERTVTRIQDSNETPKQKEALIKEVDDLRKHLEKSHGVTQILKKHVDVKNGKYIVFCKDVQHLRYMKHIVIGWFKKWFEEDGDDIEVVDYEVYHKNANSNRNLKDFEENNNDKELKLLFSVEMLNEGVHVDGITGVILLRPTISPNIYYQQLGRCLNVGSGNKIVLDLVNNFNNLGVSGLKKDLQEVIAKKREMNEKHIDIDKFLIFDEVSDVLTLLMDIESAISTDWELGVKAYKQYIEREGNDNIPPEHIEVVGDVEVQLSKFTHHVRTTANLRKNRGHDVGRLEKSKIISECIEELEKMGFIWDKRKKDFFDRFNLIKEYCKENDVDINQIDYRTSYKGVAIGQTVCRYKQKLKNNSFKEWEMWKKEVLLSLGLNNDDRLEARWESMLEQWLIANKEYNGKIPLDLCTPDGRNIANWILAQKMNYYGRGKYKNKKMSQERIDKLLMNGFDFSVKKKIKKVKISKDGVELGEYNSPKELSEKSLDEFGVELKLNMIQNACNGVTKTYKGFTFEYIED